MAQAPDSGGASAPRQNKTVKQFSGMNTQNRRNAIPEGSFGWLENIQPIGPGHLHSIPGRSLSVTRIPPFVPPPPFGCPENTLPTGAQNLEVIHCYVLTGGIPPGTLPGNSSASMSFVTGEPESFVAVITNQSGFNVPYPQVGSYNMAEATGETLSAITPLTLPGGRTADFVGQSAGTGRQGHSDERIIMHSLNNLTPTFMANGTVLAMFNYDTNVVTFFLFSGGTAAGTWAKRGNRFWHTRTAPIGLDRYDVATGGAAITNGDLSGISTSVDRIRALQATDNFLYTLIRGGGTSIVYRLNLDTMAVVDTFSGMPATALSMYVVDDDLIYIWNEEDAATWGFYYLVPSASPPVPILIDTVTKSCTTSIFDNGGQLALFFNKGYFYLSYGGFGTGAPNFTKIGPLVCPGTDIPIGS